MQQMKQHEGMMLYVYADLDAVQFFHKQGFRPVDDQDRQDVMDALEQHGIIEPEPSLLMFTSVENQLFVGQAREAEAQAEALGPELVGQRVEVFWSGEGTWYAGHVAAHNPEEHVHYVIYDDGESVWERLTAKDCKALGPGPPRAQVDTTVCAICGENGTAGPLYGPFDSGKKKDLHVHEHCIMYNAKVRLVGGVLKGVGEAIAQAKKQSCNECRRKGASVHCAAEGCKAVYHHECCKNDENCTFEGDKYHFYCPAHRPPARRHSARRAAAAASPEPASVSPAGPRYSPFGKSLGGASFEMLAPDPSPAGASRRPSARKQAAEAAAAQRPGAQNNGTTGGWTEHEDRCLTAVMQMAQPSTEKGTNGRVIGYSWSEIAAAVNRAIDNVRSENSCRHRWNKIIGRYRPTAQEKRLAESWLGSTDDEQDAGAAGGMEEEGGHEGGQDGGDVAVRECEQKVIVTSDDDMMASDADNDVVEVVSVGADIPSFLPPKPRSRTRVPHPPAPIKRSPQKAGAAQPKRSSKGRQLAKGPGGNCRICRNGRGVCRKRGEPGHLHTEDAYDDEGNVKEDEDEDEESSEESEESEESAESEEEDSEPEDESEEDESEEEQSSEASDEEEQSSESSEEDDEERADTGKLDGLFVHLSSGGLLQLYRSQKGVYYTDFGRRRYLTESQWVADEFGDRVGKGTAAVRAASSGDRSPPRKRSRRR